MIFGQTLLHYRDIKEQAKRIVDFRTELESIQDKNAKNEYIGKYTKDFLADFDNAKNNNPYEYADNTIRYFRLTRYITVRGGGFYIDLEPRRNIEIQKLLESDNASALGSLSQMSTSLICQIYHCQFCRGKSLTNY